MSGIYVHIPFCKKKCAYCDFASWPGREADFESYVKRVRDEISLSPGGRAETIFIGGGTPSILPGEYIADILDAIYKKFDATGAEITVEANPGTLDAEKCSLWARAGVNRVSIGAQAKSEALLKRLGRIHDWSRAEESVELLRIAGIENINVDLMCALPGQTVYDAAEAARATVSMGVPHVSLYSLILEEGTPLFRENPTLPGEDEAIEIQSAAIAILREAGFTRYEISNFARPGFICRHNMNYWLRGDYLGFGCAAHSFYRGARFANPRELDDYLAGVPGSEPETVLDPRLEEIMLMTRTYLGCPLDILDSRAAARLADAGLAKIEVGRFIPTDAGWMVHNALIAALI